jgi:5-amino-6-(5-phospho-D-ribitylamino)uracil phosphatase
MVHDGWRPRLVALDIDGTLVQPGDTLRPAVRNAVDRAARSGAYVVLATGRCAEEATDTLRQLELDSAHAICSNGALTMRYPDRVTIRSQTFDPGDVLRLVLSHVPNACIAFDDPEFGYLVTEYFPEGELLGPQRIRPIQSLYGRRVPRVIVRDLDRPLKEFMDLVARLEIRGASYRVGFNSWLDLGPEGVNKAVALAALAADLGVAPADCLAIGDGRNDIEMLQWAGRGVAMAEAPPEVKASADDVTGSIAAGGAAVELNSWFAPQLDDLPASRRP